MAGISSATSSKLLHSETATSDVLLQICTALNCQTEDIVEIVCDLSESEKQK